MYHDHQLVTKPQRFGDTTTPRRSLVLGEVAEQVEAGDETADRARDLLSVELLGLLGGAPNERVGGEGEGRLGSGGLLSGGLLDHLLGGLLGRRGGGLLREGVLELERRLRGSLLYGGLLGGRLGRRLTNKHGGGSGARRDGGDLRGRRHEGRAPAEVAAQDVHHKRG